MKNILIPIFVCLGISNTAFAFQADGIADDICNAKGATPMITFRAADIDVNAYNNSKGEIEYGLTLLQPNPVNNKVMLSHTSNDVYTDLILKALDQNRDIAMCFSTKGDIVSLKTMSTESK
ncbi:hypothetical protein [Photobacterium damselae]|uniref:hypothetical protein n=1 Tax=Photobacterium damselae TaxID=38293 RepID=UPI004068C158